MVIAGCSSCTQRLKASEHDQQNDHKSITATFPAPAEAQSISVRIIRTLPLQPPPQTFLVALRHAIVLRFHFSCHQGDRGVRRGHSGTTVSNVVVLLLLARPDDRTRRSCFQRRRRGRQNDTVNSVARLHVWTGFVTVHTQIVACAATALSPASAAAARPKRDQSRTPC